MASVGDPISLRPIIYRMYETWGEMLALKQDLQPFQQIARAIEDCVGHGQAGVPTRQLGMQLMQAEQLPLPDSSILRVPQSLAHRSVSVHAWHRCSAVLPPGSCCIPAGDAGCQQRSAPAQGLSTALSSCAAPHRPGPGPGVFAATGIHLQHAASTLPRCILLCRRTDQETPRRQQALPN